MSWAGKLCLLALAASAAAVIAWTTWSGRNGPSGRGSATMDVIVFLVGFAAVGLVVVWQLRIAGQTFVQPLHDLSLSVKQIVSLGNFRERVEKPHHLELEMIAEQCNQLLSRVERSERMVTELRTQREQVALKALDQLRALEDEQRDERSKHRQSVKELMLSKAAAEESSLAKSAFLFNMSHELRTPLNAIMGYSEILREDAADDPTSQNVKDIDKILGAGRHLLSLINAVLDLSKIEAGRLELEPQTFDVTQLLNDVMSTSESLAATHNNTLALEVDDGLGTMHTDVTKIRQVLLNLVGNACKFTSDGSITVKVTRQREMADWIVFSVKDTGIGLSAEDQAGLFRDFKQGDAARQRPDKGTGLGLAISQALCHLMGGKISVESTLGVGSTFTARVPAELPAGRGTAQGRALPRPAKPGADENRPAVLVIDRDPGARELVQRATSRLGYRLIEATNASEGYRLAVMHEPAAIVLEVVLSGENGWGLLERLTNLPVLEKMQVIVVSVSNEEARSRSLGAVAHFSKPAPTQKLLLQLRELVSNRTGATSIPCTAPATAPASETSVA